jgi:hypothetical protein
MTNLAELKRLAVEAHKWLSMHQARASFREPDDPPMPPHQPSAALEELRDNTGPATILSLIQRVEEAEADRELFATPIAILQERAREEGRLAGIEEAAKVADDIESLRTSEAGNMETQRENLRASRALGAAECAQAIRALKEKAE